MNEIQKRKMIKLIHTQKTRAGIDDETYCCILMGSANVQSSLDMQTIGQFTAVIAALNNLLIAQGKQPLIKPAMPLIPREIYILKKRAVRVLGVHADKRLEGFVRKIGKNSINDLSPLEIRKCHGFLTRLAQEEAK
jgi:hypothetical protein